ncbi:MAG TPA: exodeoxyribonuclease VII large subunit [Oscillospiraceae bacterium]|nr:exodeoxyribonuclease VII large subunit [Oscillospiraceae bacterium]
MYSPTPTVLTVSQLNNYVKTLLENDDVLSMFFITGEISNFKRHTSGHLYMSLKDNNSIVRSVMFASFASRLRFEPSDGMKVIVRGRASLYTRDGSYQLYIEDMQPDGVGALSLAFEQLKEKLQKEGLFNESLKKSLPPFPKKVGVITSPTGAAVRDILTVLKRRFPVAEVVFYPVTVGGGTAAAEIALAINIFNEKTAADVLIIGRGGGSAEELWAFNEEQVARAIHMSKIPIISAVGHETDFTISDFVADHRAPTPSAAAEIAVPDIIELKAFVSSNSMYMYRLLKEKLAAEKAKLETLRKARVLQSPLALTDEGRQQIDELFKKIMALMETKLSLESERLKGNCGRLSALSPLAVMARGYSIVYNEDKIITDSHRLNSGSEIEILFNKGSILALVKEIKNEQ